MPDPATRSSVLMHSGILAYLCRDRGMLLEDIAALSKHAEKFGQRYYLMAADCLRGLLFVLGEDFGAALSVCPMLSDAMSHSAVELTKACSGPL